MSRSSKRCICVIQLHYTDIDRYAEPSCNPIEKLKASGIFDEIILAAADIPENKIIRDIAKEYGIKFHLGSVDNIVERMWEATAKFQGDLVARVLIDWFYVDVSLLKNMVEYANSLEDFDYLNLPYDFDIKFGCDLLAIAGLHKIKKLFEENIEIKNKFKFRPWYLLESHEVFRTVTFDNVPLYSNEYFYQLRRRMLETAPVAWNYGSFYYYHEYEYAKKYLSKNDTVLDISCGHGNGTVILAKDCKKAYGFDIEKEYIDYAQKHYEGLTNNIEFILGDEHGTSFPDRFFDKAISVHTMEHTENDHLFLNEIKRILKNDGLLIIEVPLRLKKPFDSNNEPLLPHSDTFAGHYREYSVNLFKNLVSKYFTIQELYGVNRGYYVQIEQARNAVMAVLQK